MEGYFSSCRTMEELKAEYRRLAHKHHPDIGGDTATMQEINRQYESAFNSMKSGSTATSYRTEKYTETAEEFIAIIDALLKLHGITVELCGIWLWISGETKEVKDQLKAAGCRWSKNKKMWYWYPADMGVPRARGKSSMAQIRNKYGSRVLSSKHSKEDTYTMITA